MPHENSMCHLTQSIGVHLLITKRDYLNALKTPPWQPDLEFFPSVHSAPSNVIGKELRSGFDPKLKSKRKVSGPAAEVQPHKPPSDAEQVFCYLAPRTKPQMSANYTVFVFSRSQSLIDPPQAGSEQARPFDSGGLKLHLTNWSDVEIQSQIDELTFSGDWRTPMASYVGELFSSLDNYRAAVSPIKADPLNLPPNDKWNFTWELLVRDELPFTGRLIGVLDVCASGSVSTLGPTTILKIQTRHDTNQLVFKIIDENQSPEQALRDLCDTCINMPGWR